MSEQDESRLRQMATSHWWGIQVVSLRKLTWVPRNKSAKRTVKTWCKWRREKGAKVDLWLYRKPGKKCRSSSKMSVNYRNHISFQSRSLLTIQVWAIPGPYHWNHAALFHSSYFFHSEITALLKGMSLKLGLQYVNLWSLPSSPDGELWSLFVVITGGYQQPHSGDCACWDFEGCTLPHYQRRFQIERWMCIPCNPMHPRLVHA